MQRSVVLPEHVMISSSSALSTYSLPVGNRMEGKTVSIINRSEIVGRPLGALLANDGKEGYVSSPSRTYTPRASRASQETEAPAGCCYVIFLAPT